MDNRTSMDVFEKVSVPRAPLRNAVPAVAAMLIAPLCGPADTSGKRKSPARRFFLSCF